MVAAMAPVEIHEIHESTRKTSSGAGCNGRAQFAPFYTAVAKEVDPWDGSYTGRWVTEKVDHAMSTECRYDRSLTDMDCACCPHQGTGEAYAKMVRERGQA